MKTDEVAAPTTRSAMEESFAVARLDVRGRPVEWWPATSWAHARYAASILSELGDLHRAVVHRIEEVSTQWQ